MASTYPGSLDAFTNPTSGDTLNSPSHSGQHSDANDAIEALEAKLGVGSSPASGAATGHVLVKQADGTTAWASGSSRPMEVAAGLDFDVYDTFVRADSASSIGSATSGEAYTAHDGTYGISSNQGYLVSAGASDNVVTLDSGVAEGRFAADIKAGATSYCSLIFRGVDASNYLMAQVDPNAGSFSLFKKDTGAFTSLGSATIAVPGARFQRVEVTAVGALVVCLLDGALRITYALSGAEQTKYGAATRVGFRIGDANARVRNLAVRDLS